MTFDNVKLIGNANIYFEGKVNSRTFFLEDGRRKTLGFMMAGVYKFGTSAGEIMEVLAGEMEVTLDGETKPVIYHAGDSFTVPANSSYRAEVKDYADYCCSYQD